MSDGNGTPEGTPQGRCNYIVSFEIAMTPNGPAARSVENREPDLFELALLQTELITKIVRGALVFKGVQDRAIASRIVPVPANGGLPPSTVLPGGIYAPTP